MSEQPPILVAQHVRHAYPTGNGPLAALEDFSLALGRHTFTCLVGPSGCGKTTALRALAGLLRPSAGTIAIDGEAIEGPHRAVGMVFQQANLMPWRRVLDNIALPLELAGVDRPTRKDAARELLALVGLEGFEAAYPAELSGGMAQRVAIARALIQDPEVLLLDEPFGPLDAMTRETLGEELLRIWQARRSAVLMVTHSISEAVLLADEVLVMSQRPGRIAQRFAVGLPRPRTLEMLHSPQAGALTQAIRAAIRV
jgi:NitT/TauT family transport system ATP-binding protein